MMNFFSILRGPIMTPHCTTGFDAKQNPRRLFPNRMVLLFLRLSRLRGLHHPPNVVEFDNMEMVRAPLLNILLDSFVVVVLCVFFNIMLNALYSE